MNELFYTSCRLNLSVSGRSGFQVRAVTRGARPTPALVRTCAYELPDGAVHDDDSASRSPVRLALLLTAEEGRVLCHSVYAGRDPRTNRLGNFFSHAFFDLPASFSALDAARTWGSLSWRRADDDGPAELPESPGPAPGPLDAAALAAILTRDDVRGLLAFLIHAHLTAPPDARLIVLAEPQCVAACVLALCLCLPPSARDDLTFSTYESAPLNCEARIVGSWGVPDPRLDLPEQCYTPAGRAFNVRSGRGAVTPGDFATLAIHALAGRRPDDQTLARVLQGAAVAADHSLPCLDLLSRLARPDIPMRPEDLRGAAERPPVLAWALELPRGWPRAAEIVLTDPAQGPILLAALRRSFPDAWTRIARSVDRPDLLPLETRARVLRATPDLPPAERIRWIALQPHELVPALAMGLPPGDAADAYAACAAHGRLPGDAVNAFASRPELMAALLAPGRLPAGPALELVRAARTRAVGRLLAPSAPLAHLPREIWVELLSPGSAAEARRILALDAAGLMAKAPRDALEAVAVMWLDVAEAFRGDPAYSRVLGAISAGLSGSNLASRADDLLAHDHRPSSPPTARAAPTPGPAPMRDHAPRPGVLHAFRAWCRRWLMGAGRDVD